MDFEKISKKEASRFGKACLLAYLEEMKSRGNCSISDIGEVTFIEALEANQGSFEFTVEEVGGLGFSDPLQMTLAIKGDFVEITVYPLAVITIDLVSFLPLTKAGEKRKRRLIEDFESSDEMADFTEGEEHAGCPEFKIPLSALTW